MRDRRAEGDGRAGGCVGDLGERAGLGPDGGEPERAAPLLPLPAGLEGALAGRRPHGASARPGAAGDAGAGRVPGADRGGRPGDGDGPPPRRGARHPGGRAGPRRRPGAVRPRGGGRGPGGDDPARAVLPGRLRAGGARLGRRPRAAAGRGRWRPGQGDDPGQPLRPRRHPGGGGRLPGRPGRGPRRAGRRRAHGRRAPGRGAGLAVATGPRRRRPAPHGAGRRRVPGAREYPSQTNRRNHRSLNSIYFHNSRQFTGRQLPIFFCPLSVKLNGEVFRNVSDGFRGVTHSTMK
ncbi:hypothetical protein SGPA1_31512 [Streptomyces misionensis JCM 4497]